VKRFLVVSSILAVLCSIAFLAVTAGSGTRRRQGIGASGIYSPQCIR